MKLWQKYLLKKLLKTFFLFFCCLMIVYILIDLSIHGVRFFSKSSLWNVAIFYTCTLTALLDFFLSLSFLFASIRVLFNLSFHREIVALQMGGISKKKLLSPFFLFGGILCFLCYANGEFFSPQAQQFINTFKELHKKKKNHSPKMGLFMLPLENETQLVYQSFDSLHHELFDVYWIKNPDDLWHIKKLNIDSMEGEFANHFLRNHEKFEKSKSEIKKIFSEIPLNQQAILSQFIPYENRSLSTLLLQTATISTEKKILFSHLYYKILTPLIPFLILFAIGPSLLSYSRIKTVFFLTAYSVFGLIALKVVLDGMLILGENQVLPSYLALLSPILFVLSLCLPRFVKMQ